MGAYLMLYPESRVLTIITLVFFWEIVGDARPSSCSGSGS